MSPLVRPPARLHGFPEHVLPPSRPLFRIHRAIHGPWWFSSGTPLRFDLAPPNGVCYLAEEASGAFVEAFQDWTGSILPAAEIAARRLSTLAVPRPATLADCTDARALAFGVTAEIHSSPDRALTQEWAAAFARAGFDGVRYFVRHDPAQERVGIALSRQEEALGGWCHAPRRRRGSRPAPPIPPLSPTPALTPISYPSTPGSNVTLCLNRQCHADQHRLPGR